MVQRRVQCSLRLRLAFVVGLLLLTCAAVASPTGIDVLNNTSWTLSVLPGQSLIAGRAATLNFADGRVHGNDGCNSYGSSYSVVGDRLRIDGRLLSTRMACPEAIMRQGDAFTSVLGRASGFRNDAGRLVLLAVDGAELAIFDAQRRDLAGSAWRVSAYNNGQRAVVSVLAGSVLAFDFAADGGLAGSAGCNHFTASYSTSGQSIRVGPVAATRKWCDQPQGLMEQEKRFLQALASADTWRISGDRLELRTANGALALTSSATDNAARSSTRQSASFALRCGDQQIAARLEGDILQLRLGNETLAMQQIPAASGAKYVAQDDPTAIFWTKGQQATLTVNGRTYPECRQEASVLEGGEWVVEDMDQAGIIDNARATLHFSADQGIFGRSFCNGYTGNYRLHGETLGISVASTTRKACTPSLMRLESEFLDVLQAVRQFSLGPDGALVLRTDDGRSLVARRGPAEDGATRRETPLHLLRP